MKPPALALWAAIESLLLVGCGPSLSSRAERVAARSGDAASGQLVYTTTCESCHGVSGRGSPSSDGVSLAARVKEQDPARFIGAILDGVSGTSMLGYGDALSDQEVADLYRYISQVLAG